MFNIVDMYWNEEKEENLPKYIQLYKDRDLPAAPDERSQQRIRTIAVIHYDGRYILLRG